MLPISVGLIAIPGMMTGAILGGADVANAARMQMVSLTSHSDSHSKPCKCPLLNVVVV